MKKIFTVLLCATVLSLTGCNKNNEIEVLRKENQELKKQIEEMSKINDISDDTPEQETTIEDNRGLEPIKMGEMVQVQTDFGDFEIQIDNVRDISISEGNSKAVVINCVMHNISFSANEYYDTNMITGIFIADDNNILQLTDSEGIAFPFYNLDAPNGAYALGHKLSVGDKGYEAYAFLIPEGNL